MSIGTICLGIYLLLIGLIGLFGLGVSQKVLALLALIAGLAILFGDFLVGHNRHQP